MKPMAQHEETIGESVIPAAHAPCTPIVFAGTVGLFNPSRAAMATGLAVLFLSPWGLEEMCTRRFWRETAEALSVKGIASLRFDYPGTGDAADSDASSGLRLWEDAALEAAGQLKRISGCDRLVLVGQGVGAMMVARIAARIEGVEGLALLAPVVSGRRYLRELAMWSNVVDEGLGLTPAMRDAAAVSIAGLQLADAVAADIRKTNLNDLPILHGARYLICERPASESDIAFSAHLTASGARVERAVFSGYDDLVSNPAIAQTPQTVLTDTVAWIDGIAGPQWRIAPAARAEPAVLTAQTFIERPVWFGPGNGLFGIVCEPADGRCQASALLMGTGYDRQAGWARSTTDMARSLAASGIASLRFDAGNVGDSPPAEGAPHQVLYAPQQVDDSVAALDLIEAMGWPRAVLVGRCSGAYLAFHTVLRDRRIAGVVAVNILLFGWDPRDDVDQMIRYNPRSLSDYKQRALTFETVRRVVAGKVDYVRAGRNILKLAGRRLSRTAAPVLGRLLLDARLRNDVFEAFRTLRDRNVPLSLVYSEGDVGCERLADYFGKDAAHLGKYPNVSLATIEDADHNITPLKAREALRAHVADRILSVAWKG